MESHSHVELPEDVEEAQRFTSLMLNVYQKAADDNYAKAEALILEAMQLKEAGNAILARAAEVIKTYAVAEDEARLDEVSLADSWVENWTDSDDDIDW